MARSYNMNLTDAGSNFGTSGSRRVYMHMRENYLHTQQERYQPRIELRQMGEKRVDYHPYKLTN